MKAKTSLGIALILASIPFFVGGGVILAKTIDQNQRVERQIAATNKRCNERLKTIGDVKELSPGHFEVSIKQVKDPRKALADATIAQALCPYRALTDLCIGDACDKGGSGVSMKFSLRNRID